jgi:aspartate kinase
MNRESRITVVKVGGSLLGGKDDLRRAASALAKRRRDGGPLLVVASALQGVTDLLDLVTRQGGRPGELSQTLDALRQRHVEMASGTTVDEVREVLDELEAVARFIPAGGDLSDGAYARLLSFGERLSVILLAAAIREGGQDAEAIASEEAGLRAEGPRRAGSCDIPASAEGLERMRRRLRERVLVLTGFYGVDVGDVGDVDSVVLFGRGGSDNTACAVAAGLDADQLELWKDVPGFMSADPREPTAPGLSTTAASIRCAGVLSGSSFPRSRKPAPAPAPCWWRGCSATRPGSWPWRPGATTARRPSSERSAKGSPITRRSARACSPACPRRASAATWRRGRPGAPA